MNREKVEYYKNKCGKSPHPQIVENHSPQKKNNWKLRLNLQIYTRKFVFFNFLFFLVKILVSIIGAIFFVISARYYSVNLVPKNVEKVVYIIGANRVLTFLANFMWRIIFLTGSFWTLVSKYHIKSDCFFWKKNACLLVYFRNKNSCFFLTL